MILFQQMQAALIMTMIIKRKNSYLIGVNFYNDENKGLLIIGCFGCAPLSPICIAHTIKFASTSLSITNHTLFCIASSHVHILISNISNICVKSWNMSASILLRMKLITKFDNAIYRQKYTGITRNIIYVTHILCIFQLC